MAITDSFRNAVAAGNITSIRIMMKDSLLVDPTFGEFEEMSNATKTVDDLFDPHDGRELVFDKSNWNDDYMDKLMVQVVGNFSHERLDHLKEVVKHLRPVTKRAQATSQDKSSSPGSRKSYQEQKRQDERDGRIAHNRGIKIAAGSAAGGVAGGALVAILGGGTIAVVAGAVAGAAAVGVVVAKTTC